MDPPCAAAISGLITKSVNALINVEAQRLSYQVEVTTGSRPGGSCRPGSGVGYVARAIANPPLCVSISLPSKVKMTRTEIRPAFDPALQPIGYALASELLAEDMTIEVPPARAVPIAGCAPPDLFGWERVTD